MSGVSERRKCGYPVNKEDPHPTTQFLTGELLEGVHDLTYLHERGKVKEEDQYNISEGNSTEHYIIMIINLIMTHNNLQSSLVTIVL